MASASRKHPGITFIANLDEAFKGQVVRMLFQYELRILRWEDSKELEESCSCLHSRLGRSKCPQLFEALYDLRKCSSKLFGSCSWESITLYLHIGRGIARARNDIHAVSCTAHQQNCIGIFGGC